MLEQIPESGEAPAQEAEPKAAAEELVGDLNARLGGRSVFICTHKHQEPYLASLDTSFGMHTGHWGAVDGSNAWRECDAAVIFGLPYRPDTWSANAFFALRGVQDTAWLRSKDERAWGNYQDIRSALKTGQTVTEVVQAINRIRCRKVIDTEGNCPKADVYLLLPDNKLGGDILAGIRREMPGIVVREWTYGGAKAKTKPRRSNHETALSLYLRGMPCGRVSASHLKSELGIPSATWDRLTKSLRDSSSPLGMTLAASGVRYEVGRSARTRRASLVKD